MARRPHEDLDRHTLSDHHPGGPAIDFVAPAWWAIAVVHVAAERAAAGIASYETLIEKARTSAPKAHEAAILRSHNRRRVIVLLRLDGHDAFGHLTAAWDEHHLLAERHAIAESRSIALYRLATSDGEAVADPTSTDAYAFEHLVLGPDRTRALAASILAAPGFRGVSIFGTDDDGAVAILYRFAHIEQVDAFRATAEAQQALGPIAAGGETFHQVHVVRTFE